MISQVELEQRLNDGVRELVAPILSSGETSEVMIDAAFTLMQNAVKTLPNNVRAEIRKLLLEQYTVTGELKQ